MALSFKGGIHPRYNKEKTFASPIAEAAEPSEVVIPLLQNIGRPCEPTVSVGDYVLLGQKIGDSEELLSCPVHASVSGVVEAIEPRWHPNGSKVPCIIIKNDFLDKPAEEIPAWEDSISELSPADIIKYSRAAGITGMGGAAFPLHVKLQTAIDKKVSTVIINGAECEPYITTDHRAMVEYPNAIIEGIKLIMKCLGTEGAVIAIEENKPDAIAIMQTASRNTGIEVVELKTKYPQGGERQIVKAVTGREIPGNKLPTDVGCAVFNVDTCACLYRAVFKGRPVIKRVVTVSGSAIANPKNLLVRIGTKYSHIIAECDGFIEAPKKIIAGGPMMGLAQHTTDIPIIKGTSAVLAFCEDEEEFTDEQLCIRCGRCVRACPMRLMPNYLHMYASQDNFSECERLNVFDCIECGCCSYVCPGRIYLVQSMRMIKAKLREGKNGK